MGLSFVKMHGCGNDYVYVDGFRAPLADPVAAARRLSDRHTGVGADGLILMLPSGVADVRMRMFNADGSEGAMCGNGVRCLAKLACDEGRVTGPRLRVEVGLEGARRVITVAVTRERGRVAAATVDMGPPRFSRRHVPMAGAPDEEALEVPLEVALPGGSRERLAVTGVSMGNPHCVLFLEEPATDRQVAALGPALERHPLFPDRANVGFACLIAPERLRLRVWERGSGETRACGTGAAAAVAAAVRTGRTGATEVGVELPGGLLRIAWRGEGRTRPGSTIELTGPAVEVFRGELTG